MTVTKTGAPLTNYQLNYDGDKLVIVLPEGTTTQSYVLEYDMVPVSSADRGPWSNYATLTGFYLEGTERVTNVSQSLASGEGWATFRLVAAVNITKQDAYTGGSLSGVDFELHQAADGVHFHAVKSGKTDADGKITFSGLDPKLFYKLVEITPPGGYGTFVPATVEVIGATDYILLTEFIIDDDYMISPYDDIDVIVHNTRDVVDSRVAFMKSSNRAGTSLSGAVFSLTPTSLNPHLPAPENAVSDGDGNVRFEDAVQWGVYTLKEVTALPGHDLDTTEYTVTVNQDGTYTIMNGSAVVGTDVAAGTIENQFSENRFAFTKTSDNPDITDFSGATFRLSPAKGENQNLLPAPGYKDATSGADGKVHFTELPFGKYMMTETKAIIDHHLGITVYDVIVNQNGTYTIMNGDVLVGDDTAAIEIENQYLHDFGFKKLSSRPGADVSNAKFLLTNDAKGISQEAESDTGGDVIFNKIPAGIYTLEELAAPKNHHIPQDSFTVTIDRDGTAVITCNGEKVKDNGIVNLHFFDFTFYKVSSRMNSPLEGAKFKLTPEKGNPYVMPTPSGSLEGVSDSEGRIIFKNLPMGEYDLLETYALSGHIFSGEPFHVLINPDGTAKMTGEPSNIHEIVGDDKIINVHFFDLVFKKTSDRTDISLAGAEFELICADGTIYPKIAISDVNGMVSFEEIPEGNYTMVELKAPANHIRSNATFYVTVDNEGIARLWLDEDYTQEAHEIQNTYAATTTRPNRSGGRSRPPMPTPTPAPPDAITITTPPPPTTPIHPDSTQIVPCPDNPGQYIEICDEGIPRGRWIFDDEKQEWVFIPDSDTPLAAIPLTGVIDFSTIICLMAAAGGILIFMAAILKKRVKKK